MLRILYISPENTVGVLGYWRRAHTLNGHYCRYVTFFRSAGDFEEDICLELPLVAARPWFLRSRIFFARYVERRNPWRDIGGNPPWWRPPVWQQLLFRMREALWLPRIQQAIRRHRLADFDVYHFEWGTDFFRDARFAAHLKRKGKKIICHYHGQDMRNRGVIPAMDALSDLNLTNELDLMYRHPNIRYLFLPYDVQAHSLKTETGRPLTLCHATTNRLVKGSDHIIAVCRELEQSHGVRFLFIENQPHQKVLELKRQADIYIDQITDHAWGYGMNSLEALAMGIPCVTYLNSTYTRFIPDHPFISADGGNLRERLVELIEQPELIRQIGTASRRWVEKYHDYRNVVTHLYEYYRTIGLRV